jgi:hypothetical protein
LKRGSVRLLFQQSVLILDDGTFSNRIFTSSAEYSSAGKLSINKQITLNLNGDRFSGSTFAVVGSTGSEQSCTGCADRFTRPLAFQTQGKIDTLGAEELSAS